MRIFQNKPFQRFGRRESIQPASLCEAVERAEAGHVDADLGGNVIKQRIPRSGEGRSGGFRSIILYREGERAFFVYAFPKNQRANITEDELRGFRALARVMLALDEDEIELAVETGALREVDCDEENA